MQKLQNSVKVQRRQTLVIAVAVLGIAAPFTFVAAPQPPPAIQEVANRRSLLGAVAASSLLGLSAPVMAADKAPTKLEAYGLQGKRAKAVNGLWSVFPDTKVNGRAVYKKDDADIYLTFNNCQQFQLAKKPTGECEGFALEYQGTWEVDGQDTRMKLKPYKTQEEMRAEAKAKREAQQSSGGGGFFQLGKLEEPKKVLTQKEMDDELLMNDLVEYGRQKAKGGATGFAQNFMVLEQEEEKIADSLEARLNAKLDTSPGTVGLKKR